jgi:hypothetical protein
MGDDSGYQDNIVRLGQRAAIRLLLARALLDIRQERAQITNVPAEEGTDHIGSAARTRARHVCLYSATKHRSGRPVAIPVCAPKLVSRIEFFSVSQQSLPAALRHLRQRKLGERDMRVERR